MGKVLSLPAGAGGLRALDRLSDLQLMAVQARVLQGWRSKRIAQRLGVELPTVERWFRDPVVVAAGVELQRAYLASELLPLGLQRLRFELASPATKAGEVTRMVRLVAELAGVLDAGGEAAGSADSGRRAGAGGLARPLDECSAAELAQLADQGRAALAQLQRLKPAEIGETARNSDRNDD